MSDPINSLPAGYTLTDNKGWVHYSREGVEPHIQHAHIRWLRPALERRDDGSIHWKTNFIDQWGNTVLPIPDIQHPAGGMTTAHTVFDETTQKWTLPSIEDSIHAHHERNHDGDVAAADAAICQCEIDLLHRKALMANLNPDQKAVADTAYGDFEKCIDDIVDANAEPVIERAWIKSVGHVTLPATDEGQVQKAHNFAAAYLTMIRAKTQSQRIKHLYYYHMCLRSELLKDRDRTGNARFLPKGVVIVETLSSPAKSEEVTAESVFNKLKALISPSEGEPKQPA